MKKLKKTHNSIGKNFDSEKLKSELKALSENPPVEYKVTTRTIIEDNFNYINSLINDRVPIKKIVELFSQNDITISESTFKSYLSKIKKEKLQASEIEVVSPVDNKSNESGLSSPYSYDGEHNNE
ncbi:hypothetical protein ACTL6P_15415 [Endozoicomonas acroporae]|uniref:hypothetical protein n=1 Tax=Endozoicomonas acroporae TaxID=1701104 RepID=UPI000C77DE33|nr:hypothetical protein [Endozoicomonas acroporae]